VTGATVGSRASTAGPVAVVGAGAIGASGRARLPAEGAATVADVDTAISDGPGRRSALTGPFTTQHLGGEGGVAHVLEHLGPPIVEWRTLDTPARTLELEGAVADRVGSELDGADVERVTAEPDAPVAEMLSATRRRHAHPSGRGGRA
jgi:carnitine 3-dehydrogenase